MTLFENYAKICCKTNKTLKYEFICTIKWYNLNKNDYKRKELHLKIGINPREKYDMS
jgi:hypothetical protein